MQEITYNYKDIKPEAADRIIDCFQHGSYDTVKFEARKDGKYSVTFAGFYEKGEKIGIKAIEYTPCKNFMNVYIFDNGREDFFGIDRRSFSNEIFSEKLFQKLFKNCPKSQK